MSCVSRFKICTYELGSGSLTPDEQSRIRKALQLEAERLRNVPNTVEFRRSEIETACLEVP